MKKIIQNNYKFIIGIIVGLIISVTSVYAVDAYIESKKVSYDNSKSNGSYNEVQSSIDELYERSGIHKEKWIDPVLNGADPVLKDPLIPVDIKPNGEVYYANLNSEWYNYSEKRWANAVILIDNPSNKNYKTGDHILEDDIESYFVWIPRYQYKVWTLANTEEYTKAIDGSTLSNTNKNLDKIESHARIIDVLFCTYEKCPKMNESEAVVDKYFTHPAFTLGSKDLNGIWVGKFETGGSENNLIIKPNVSSMRGYKTKVYFNSAKGYDDAYNNILDSHMMKNTEWGAVAYLSHSAYGVGTEVNINNNSKFITGYSAAPNVNVAVFANPTGTTDDITRPYNTPTGYLASTTGNISGIYDMRGGAWEYMAACADGLPGNSDFSVEELSTQMNAGYIDRYPANVSITSYDKRILGDGTAEMGPVYYYYKGGTNNYHNSWYADEAIFINPETGQWFHRGRNNNFAGLSGQFSFAPMNGGGAGDSSFRLVLAPTK